MARTKPGILLQWPSQAAGKRVVRKALIGVGLLILATISTRALRADTAIQVDY